MFKSTILLVAMTFGFQAFGESVFTKRGEMVQYEIKLMSSDWVCSETVAGTSPSRNPHPYNDYEKECVIGLSNIKDRLGLDNFATIRLKSNQVMSDLDRNWGLGDVSQDNTKYKPIRITMFDSEQITSSGLSLYKAIKEGKLYIELIYEGIRK